MVAVHTAKTKKPGSFRHMRGNRVVTPQGGSELLKKNERYKKLTPIRNVAAVASATR